MSSKIIINFILGSLQIIFYYFALLIFINLAFLGFDFGKFLSYLSSFLSFNSSYYDLFFLCNILFLVLLPSWTSIYLIKSIERKYKFIFVPIIAILMIFFVSVFLAQIEKGDMKGVATAFAAGLAMIYQILVIVVFGIWNYKFKK